MMETFKNFNLSLQIIFIFLAFVFNVLLVISTKIEKGKAILATEILQLTKTSFVILSLVLCAPIEVYILYDGYISSWALCIVRDFLEQLSMGFFSAGFLAIAIIRLKVWKCIGIASATIKQKSAFKILSLCLITPTVIALSTMILSISWDKDHSIQPAMSLSYSTCHGHSIDSFRIAGVIVSEVFPIVVTLGIYWRLHKEIKHRSKINITRQSRGQKKSITNKALKGIRQSLCSVVIVLMVTWMPYVVLKVIHYTTFASPLFKQAISTTYVYSKLGTFLCHPFAEGLLLEQRRHRLTYFFHRLRKKNAVGISTQKASREIEATTVERSVRGSITDPDRVLETVVEEEADSEDLSYGWKRRGSIENDGRISMINLYEDSEVESRHEGSLVHIKTNTNGTSMTNNIPKVSKVAKVIAIVDHHAPPEDRNLKTADITKTGADTTCSGLEISVIPSNSLTNVSVSPDISILTCNTAFGDDNYKVFSIPKSSNSSRIVSSQSSSLNVKKSSPSHCRLSVDRDCRSEFSVSSNMSCNCLRCTQQRRLSFLSTGSSGHRSRKSSFRSQKTSEHSFRSSVSGPLSWKKVRSNKETESDAFSLMSEYF